MSTRKTKALIATALIGLTGAAAVAAPAQASELTSTKVTIKGENGDYYGYVKSADPDCADDREVKVFKVKHGDKQLIGTDTSSPNGTRYMWSIGNSGYKHGSFYAKVKKTGTCGGDTSKTIRR